MGLIPVEATLVPVVLALRDGYPRLLMAPVDPTVVTNAHANSRARRGEAGGDPGAWIAQLVGPQLPGAVLTSRFSALPPRHIRPEKLAIPVWATARIEPDAGAHPSLLLRLPPARHARELHLVDAHEGLERLGRELGDPDFGPEVLAAVREALAADPFAQRVMGDGLRLGALLGDRRRGDHGPALPAVVALLPRTFTLSELRDAVAAALGMHPREFDFGSGLRRRINEFVLMRVLREVGSTRDLPDHDGDGPGAGRPARRYEFDEGAWHTWLRERGERGAGAGSRQHSSPASRDDSPTRLMLMSQARPGSTAMPPRMAPTAPAEPEPAPRGRETRETDERIMRLERMVEQIVQEIGKRAGRE
jgi:hypothetical protein